MANPRKHPSDDDDFVPDPKRRMQAKNTGGKTTSAPIDVDATAAQRQSKTTPNKTPQKKGTPASAQKSQAPRPGGTLHAQHAKQRRREESAKPGDGDVTETPAPVEPPKPPRPYEVIEPFPTHAQYLRDDFPIYADADTLIVLDPEHHYFLHSATLKRPIPFFKEDELRNVLFKEIHRPGVQLPIWEKKEKLDFTRMKKYLLEVEESGEGYILKRVPFTRWKEIPKPPVVEDRDAVNKEAVAGPTPDTTKTPGVQGGDSIAAPAKPARAVSIDSAIQDPTPAGPAMNSPNNTTTAAQQPSAPPSTQASQTTSAPSPSQTSSATTVGPSQNSASARTARPAPKLIAVKQENGVSIKVEVVEDDDSGNASSSVTPGAGRQPGLDMSTLPELNGRRVIEMHGKAHYIEVVDPADPQQLTAQNTINLGGLVYRVIPVNPRAPASPAAAVAVQAQVEEVEEEIAEPLPPNPCPPLLRQDIIFGFSSLFAIIYNQPSLISTSNINTALLQCESLIAAATSVNALRVVTANIGNSIMNFGKVVYLAILDNPRRWLKLAVEIGHGAIFQEAVVHVVGCWPDVVSESHFSMLDKTTVDLLEKKATELRLKCYEVNEKLFAASLEIGKDEKSVGRVELDAANTRSFDSWLIVQLWRDWYSNQLSLARMPRTPENIAKAPEHYVSFTTLQKLGALFRLLDTGGDAYLAKDDVGKLLQAYKDRKPKSHVGLTGFLHFVNWEEDLKRMKEFAKSVVSEVMVNHSMLAPKEHGLHYFTCTLVPEGERPWEVEGKEKK